MFYVSANPIPGQTIDSNDVADIQIICDIAGQGYPKPPEQSYAYFTGSTSEIQYIIHYIDSFDLVYDGITASGGDLPIVNIDIKLKDGTVNKVGFVCGRFYDENSNQYAVDSRDYQRFLGFTYALKTGVLVLYGAATLEPTEWAVEYVDFAMENGLLPLWFRIGYDGNITRLEFCQLVENYLQVSNMQSRADDDSSHTFNDVKDSSVAYLWNHGIIKGKSDTQFCPYDAISREELSTILKRIYDYMGNDICNAGDSILFDDLVEISEWAKDSVNFVSSYGLMIGDNNEFRPKDYLTKQETIIALVRLHKVC